MGLGDRSPTTSTALDGNVGVNAGFLVGHCALRRYVMGADAVGSEATPEQLDAMVRAAARRRSRPAGSASRPRSRSRTPTATASRSRRAGRRTTSCSRCARRSSDHEGTTLEGIVDGCLDQFSDDEIELLVDDVASPAGRPLNWNVLTVDSREPERVPRQLAACDRAAEARRPRRRADDADARRR